MGIKVSGLDKAIELVRELEESLHLTVQDRWINSVTNKAKEICNDPDCKRIRLVKNENEIAVIRIDDAFAIDCVIDAIKELEKDMPLGIREWFNRIYIPQLETEKKKMTAY